jgi:hypothetical protein
VLQSRAQPETDGANGSGGKTRYYYAVPGYHLTGKSEAGTLAGFLFCAD